jgi:hypothetical protein
MTATKKHSQPIAAGVGARRKKNTPSILVKLRSPRNQHHQTKEDRRTCARTDGIFVADGSVEIMRLNLVEEEIANTEKHRKAKGNAHAKLEATLSKYHSTDKTGEHKSQENLHVASLLWNQSIDPAW